VSNSKAGGSTTKPHRSSPEKRDHGKSGQNDHGRNNQGRNNQGRRNSPGLAPRKVAAHLLRQIITGHTALDALLEDSKDSGYARLTPQDKALARAIASTTLRHFGEIEQLVSKRLTGRMPPSAPYLPGVIYTAVAQILFMEVADHAAVSLAVDAAASDPKAKHFKPLVNGILRGILRERDEFQPDATLNAPDWLREMLIGQYGAEKAGAIMQANMQRAGLDLTIRKDAEGWAKRLDGELIGDHTVRLAPGTKVYELDGFKSGAWWVQDAAASVPADLLLQALHRRAAISGANLLDACAAPGGKTAQLAAAGAKVTALDISEPRLVRLRENMQRLNLQVDIVAADLLDMDEQPVFDGILLDAPCSATGTIRRHPDVPWLKTRKQIDELAELQRKMLAKAAKLLRPGGILLYCSCSLLAEEGESHLDYVQNELGFQIDPISTNETALCSPLTVANGVFRSTPDMPAGLDGFFVTRLVHP
tara:strand:- start:10229 stop:11659 length:1431 start_codon:yes stop_codon:yes gene_type:complete